MNSARRVCIVTGSRADFDLYRPLLTAIEDTPGLTAEIAVTGMHLSPDFGSTAEQVEDLGFPITGRIETLLSGDTPTAVTKSCGLGVIGFADLWRHDPPDLVFVLGDRFEMFAATQAAYLRGLPIAHIAGGDVTTGSLDDGMRHAISKLSHLHFPSNQDAAERLARMGEAPSRIHMVGSPALDAIADFQPLAIETIEARLEWKWRPLTLLVTLHPDTSGGPREVDELAEMLEALEALEPEIGIILTLPNADAGGWAAGSAMIAFAATRENVIARASLGQELYLSCMAHCAAVVGNSSSGLYEAPSFSVPTVNIGGRQNGRIRASSVINTPPRSKAITAAINQSMAEGRRETVNPYGDGRAVKRILATLRHIDDFQALTQKGFHDPQPGTRDG
jgi:UDP-hydrolysing UDP-N-acetyl-D-glucosamine 2-epimerase